jgi:hypothetical protein
MNIKNFKQFNEDIKIVGKIDLPEPKPKYKRSYGKEIGKVEKPVEIRFNVEESRHLWNDRKYRHGFENKIEDEEVINLVNESIEQLTIDLMRGDLDIKETFIIKSPDLSIACKLESGEYNFDLKVITARRERLNTYKGQYVYDISKKSPYRFKINELNHQSPGMPLGVNSPGFGQGAHVGNWGADYGNPSKGVRGHFGNKGDKTSQHLPQKYKQQDFPSVVYDPTTNNYLTEDEVKELLREYDIKCKQNSETPQTFNNVDSKTIEFIKNYLSE